MIKTSRKGAFTLIELLVVISIIALLAGLAFPALTGAMEAAQKAKATTMCNQLSIAITLYNTEYGVWPTVGNNGTNGDFTTSSAVGDLCWALNGCRELDGSGSVSITSNSPNPRGIQFMSFNKNDLASGSKREIISPYKKPTVANRTYKIKTDADYDNVITSIPIPSANNASGTAVLGVAVWTYGDAAGTASKMLTSYK